MVSWSLSSLWSPPNLAQSPLGPLSVSLFLSIHIAITLFLPSCFADGLPGLEGKIWLLKALFVVTVNHLSMREQPMLPLSFIYLWENIWPNQVTESLVLALRSSIGLIWSTFLDFSLAISLKKPEVFCQAKHYSLPKHTRTFQSPYISSGWFLHLGCSPHLSGYTHPLSFKSNPSATSNLTPPPDTAAEKDLLTLSYFIIAPSSGLPDSI